MCLQFQEFQESEGFGNFDFQEILDKESDTTRNRLSQDCLLISIARRTALDSADKIDEWSDNRFTRT
jgi:hypothetical protein